MNISTIYASSPPPHYGNYNTRYSSRSGLTTILSRKTRTGANPTRFLRDTYRRTSRQSQSREVCAHLSEERCPPLSLRGATHDWQGAYRSLPYCGRDVLLPVFYHFNVIFQEGYRPLSLAGHASFDFTFAMRFPILLKIADDSAEVGQILLVSCGHTSIIPKRTSPLYAIRTFS